MLHINHPTASNRIHAMPAKTKRPVKRKKKQTTINLPETVLTWLQGIAKDEGRTLSNYLERLAGAERRRQELKSRRACA